MNQTDTSPSTLIGVKRLAKRLARENNLPHHQALAQAAGIAGFSNYAHAHRSLSSNALTDVSQKAILYLTAYWRDPNAGTEGRETLEVRLPRRIDDLLGKPQRYQGRWICEFKRAAPDHLVSRVVMNSQETARNAIGGAHRVLQFMAVTGLKPADSRAMMAMSARGLFDLPRRDHSSGWMDPATRALVMIDEPYRSVHSACYPERVKWAAQRGLVFAAMTWEGMYAPGYSTMYVLTESGKGLDVEQLMDRINALPAGQWSWSGISAPYRPLWRSPEHSTKQLPQSIDRSLPAKHSPNSVPNGGILVPPGSQRPAGRMPIEAHRRSGELLRQAEIAVGKSARCANWLTRVWGELDEWVQREYTREEMDDATFFALYKRADILRSPTKANPPLALRCIDEIDGLINAHYPDCVPRRNLLKDLDRVRQHMLTHA